MIRRKRLRPERVERPEIVRNPRLRDLVFARDGGRCARCKRYVNAWICEHKNPLWRGGADDIDNLQTLCRDCDKPKTSREATERAKADRLAARHQETQRRKPVRTNA